PATAGGNAMTSADGPAEAGQRGVLKVHWMPLANAALRAGHAAFLAQCRAARAHSSYTAAAARPRPGASRERGWAVRAPDRLRAEAGEAAATAGTLTEQWAGLMDRLGALNPGAADSVDHAVWQVPERAGAVAAVTGWQATRLRVPVKQHGLAVGEDGRDPGPAGAAQVTGGGPVAGLEAGG